MGRPAAVDVAEQYYDSSDADNFYFHVWGGEDIHVGIYESSTESVGAASARTVARMAAHLNGVDADCHVLDLGAGYGGAARQLVKALGCKVTCLNLSETQNRRNEALNAEANLANRVTVMHGSFEDIPLPAGTVNFAWSQDAILHAANREQVFREVDRVLKPGGEFIFTDPMQSDDCPEGVLQPVLDRIHLESLGAPAVYRDYARKLGWSEVGFEGMTAQLVTHYSRVKETLLERREALTGKVSPDYLQRMLTGLDNWVSAGEKGYLAWGILHFRKPA